MGPLAGGLSREGRLSTVVQVARGCTLTEGLVPRLGVEGSLIEKTSLRAYVVVSAPSAGVQTFAKRRRTAKKHVVGNLVNVSMGVALGGQGLCPPNLFLTHKVGVACI